MQYMGGKSRVRKQVAAYLESVREGKPYCEPFVGGAWVLQEMTGDRTAMDANEALITMYQSLQAGWVPPDSLSEDEYAELRHEQDPKDPMTAFAGFGCSFAGKWFGGYARSSKQINYALSCKNSLLQQVPRLFGAEFLCRDFFTTQFFDCLVYCDPPYEGTTAYSNTVSFDTGLFWEKVRTESRQNTVVVSEYSAPSDFVCVLEIPTKTEMRGGEGRIARIEKLFRWKGSL